jgi:hypothetical protein
LCLLVLRFLLLVLHCRPGPVAPLRTSPGKQKTPRPEAQEVADERDVAFVVR